MSHCSRCGECCKNVYLKISPKELRQSYLKWKNKKEGEGEIYMDIDLIYPMLTYLQYDRKFKGYRYKCKHLSFKDSKAFCTIHHIKPDVCKDYGEGICGSRGNHVYPNCAYYKEDCIYKEKKK